MVLDGVFSDPSRAVASNRTFPGRRLDGDVLASVGSFGVETARASWPFREQSRLLLEIYDQKSKSLDVLASHGAAPAYHHIIPSRIINS